MPLLYYSPRACRLGLQRGDNMGYIAGRMKVQTQVLESVNTLEDR